MITTIRKSFKTRAYKIMLWIVFLSMAIGGGLFSLFEILRSTFFGKPSGSWVIQINKQTIAAPEFMRSVADQEERIRIIRSQYGQYADMYFQMMGMKLDSQELAMNALIRKALLNQVATQLPFSVNPQMAQSQLNNPVFITEEVSDLVPFFTWDQSLGGVNPITLHTYLQRIGVSTSEFEHALAQGFVRHNLKNIIEHGGYTPQFELKEQFAQNFLGHKFSIITIPAQEMLAQAKKEAASDEKLKSYYDLKNTQERRYFVPEKRSAKIVTFDPASYGISISDDDVEKYYNNNKAQYVEQPAQVQVRHILLKVADPAKEQEIEQKAKNLRNELLNAPATFAAKAKELSEDTKTAAQGGTMPFFGKGTHDRTFEKTSFLLKEDGDISEVVRTGEGFEIIQRISKKAQTFKPLTQVSKEIKDALRKKKFAEQFGSDVRAVLAQSNPTEALATFTKQKNGKESISQEVTANDSILSKTIFRINEKGTSFYQDPNQGVVVTVTAVKPSYAPALEEIKARVAEDYYKDQASTALADRLESFKKPGAFQEAIKQGTKVEKTGWLTHSFDAKDDEQEKQALTKKGINLGKLFQIENIGGVVAHEGNGNGYVIRLDERAPFDEALFQAKSKTIQSELEQQTNSLLMAGFVASLYRNAKINKNESQIRIQS